MTRPKTRSQRTVVIALRHILRNKKAGSRARLEAVRLLQQIENVFPGMTTPPGRVAGPPGPPPPEAPATAEELAKSVQDLLAEL